MAFKFFNIGKANEEITRLEGEVARLTTEAQTATENANAVAAAAEQCKTDLTAAQTEITTLKANLVQKDSDLATVASVTEENKTLKATIADPKGEIANRAAELARAQGVPAPIAIAQTPNPSGNPDKLAEAKKLTGLAKFVAIEKLESEARKQKLN